MKKLFVTISILSISLSSLVSFSQNEKPKTITVSFKNNSLLPHKYSFITYAPNEKSNGTFADFLMPYGTKELKVVEGTKIYLANQKQVDIVMSGNPLSGKPFYIAKAEDNGKTINLKAE